MSCSSSARRCSAPVRPGLDVQGVVGATFCARDGIADPNGVTVGFANAARALGVEVVRAICRRQIWEVGHCDRHGDAVTSGGVRPTAAR